MKLFVDDSSDSGGAVYKVPSTWSETGLTWNNAPALAGSPLITQGAVSGGSTVSLDVTNAVVNQTGDVSFGITSGSADFVQYSSREGAHPPVLELTH